MKTRPDQSAKTERFPIAGVGASAGGLAAFTQLLKALPPRPGIGLVLIQHLDPSFPSELTHILASATALPVTTAQDDEPVRRNHIYVLPSKSLLTIAEGRLRLAPRADGHPFSVDHFLTSLATDLGPLAIGVVLSGSGTDGVRGLRAIKTAGGATFAQDPETAEHGEMPRYAAESGSVDHVLPPTEIAAALADPVRRAPIPHGGPHSPPSGEAGGDPVDRIKEILRDATGVDFRYYKSSTLRRRIERRLAHHHLGDLAGYTALLRRDANEVAALYREVLLHVTGFFREPAALAYLKDRVLPDLLRKSSADTPLRVWVPGCASGEEVYSIAICALEAQAETGRDSSLQIFGTDLTEEMLEVARRGWYPRTIAGDVSADRLDRFFTRSGEGFQVGKQLRQACIFSRHDITQDPPYSRLDLVSCRNVLIYFDPVLQARVLQVFHYALRPGGFLMLGPAETIGGLGELFSLRDQTSRIYLRQEGASRLPSTIRGTSLHGPQALGAEASLARQQLSALEGAVEAAVVAEFGAPGVVVNKDLEIVQYRGQTSPYLAVPSGQPTVKLLKMAHPDLRVHLGRMIRRVRGNRTRMGAHGLKVRDGARERWVNLHVIPVTRGNSDEPCFLVVFESVPGRVRPAGGQSESDRPMEATLAELQTELDDTRDYLQAMLDDHERAHAELQAAHEDALSFNEEFQSTNEELTTTKEEIQSVNEELTTINEELRNRNIELQDLNTDLANVLESVDIPVIICDRDLRLRRFSPSAGREYGLDLLPPGSRVTDASMPLDRSELEAACGSAIRSGTAGYLQFQDGEGKWHELRSWPYRDTDRNVVGVVLALVDIDGLKKAEAEIGKGRDYSAAIVETVPNPMVVLDRNLQVISANKQFSDTFGRAVGHPWQEALQRAAGDLWQEPLLRERLAEVQQSGRSFDGLEMARDIRGLGSRLFRIGGRRIAQPGADEQNILITMEDITERRLLDQRLQQGAKMQAMGQIAGGVAHEINNQMQAVLGFSNDLLQKMDPGNPQRQDLEYIIKAARRSAEVTRNLLAFSRQQVMLPKRLVLDEVAGGIAGFLRQLLGPETELELVLGAPHASLYIEQTQLEQVLVNLSLNARDAMPLGGRVSIETSRVLLEEEYAKLHGGVSIRPGPHLRIQVRDTGIGMDRATLERVFEPFFTTKPVGEGTGLGLASTYGIVKQAGGYIWIESQRGKGTTVTLDLPELTHETEPAPEEPAGPAPASGGSETILVVEDEGGVRAWTCRLLDQLGYSTIPARNGTEALGLLGDGVAADLVLSDVVMPRMSGRELASRIAKLRPDLPVLFMSGYSREEIVGRGLLEESARLVTKPFTDQILGSAIRGVLASQCAIRADSVSPDTS